MGLGLGLELGLGLGLGLGLEEGHNAPPTGGDHVAAVQQLAREGDDAARVGVEDGRAEGLGLVRCADGPHRLEAHAAALVLGRAVERDGGGDDVLVLRVGVRMRVRVRVEG